MKMAQPPSKESEAEIARLMALQFTSPSKFQILGIDWHTATVESVKSRFKKLVVLTHPDKVNHPKAAEAFAMVNGAYKLLATEALIKYAREPLEKKHGVAATSSASSKPATTANPSDEEAKKKLEEAARKKIEEDYLAAVRDAQQRENRRERDANEAKEKQKEKEDIMFHAKQWKDLGLGKKL